MAYRKTGTQDHSGTLVRPFKTWKTGTRDPRGTLPGPYQNRKTGMGGVGGLHGHAIRSHRLLHKEVAEVQSNYEKSYFWWFGNLGYGKSTGSNHTEKDQGRVSVRRVWGKRGENGQCDLVRAERLQRIGLMVVMLMVLFTCDDLVSILSNGCGIWGQNSVALFQEKKWQQGCIPGI